MKTSGKLLIRVIFLSAPFDQSCLKINICLYFKDRAGLLPGILPTDPCDGDLTDPELDEVSWSTTKGTCTTCDILC